MDKKEVQKRVLQNGKPLALNKFSWDEKTKTFSSIENNLTINFDEIDYCTFKTGYGCTFDTGYECTFDTGYGCTFYTGFGCTFDTGFGCTFKTSSNCTFKTCSECTFDTGSECVIVRRDKFEVIQPLKNESIEICPYDIPGYISKREGENAYYMDIDGKRIEHIIADGILSQVIKKRGNIYHVKNYGADKITYLIEEDGVYSYGDTLKEAKESFMYKIVNRDTSQYQSMTLDTVLTKEEAIKMYRVITGACEAGTRYFIENVLKKDIKKASIREIIELTKGQYNCHKLQEFFKDGE